MTATKVSISLFGFVKEARLRLVDDLRGSSSAVAVALLGGGGIGRAPSIAELGLVDKAPGSSLTLVNPATAYSRDPLEPLQTTTYSLGQRLDDALAAADQRDQGSATIRSIT